MGHQYSECRLKNDSGAQEVDSNFKFDPWRGGRIVSAQANSSSQRSDIWRRARHGEVLGKVSTCKDRGTEGMKDDGYLNMMLRSAFGLLGDVQVADSVSFLDFAILYNERVKSPYFELLCVLCWCVWHRRNQSIHGSLAFPVSKIFEWGLAFLHDFCEASRSKLKGQTGSNVVPCWQALQLGAFKINTDAALHSSDKVSGIGVVIQDNDAHVRASLCQNLSAYFQPQIAEALAILKGLFLALNNGFVPAVLESDALTVVNSICLKMVPCNEVGVVIHDVLRLLNDVDSFSINYVLRLANKVAHSLAKLALNYVG
ncbi:hypothetical protein EZV62_007481 [Acer yangbiense]|uniref:RNase H type-1 domain-containing protein n=1 Tax=Acer yangbiense TaxID=1000413 RepID=A0A5C7ICQ3_9ROSI|nr:hypothetical protein EZV62_007481 [Acer yangbiense]